MAIEPGLVGEYTTIVKESDTAAAVAGGNLPPVLSTPRVVSLLETTAHSAIEKFLAEGQTSVGVSVHLNHTAATPVGMQVRFRLELLEVDGRRLRFKVEAWDEVEQFASGEHERFIIDCARFAERLEKKVQSLKK
ncbi:MAG: thioesterase family protein [Anaerolineae bacterium]|nr:thioesterase family protein [Anaerolineae bacterium]